MDGTDRIRTVFCRASLEGDWQMDGTEERGDGRIVEGLVGSVEVTVEVADASDYPELRPEESESKQQFGQQLSEQQAGEQNAEMQSEPDTGERYLHACLLDPSSGEEDRIFPLPLQRRLQFRMQAKQPVLWNAEQPRYYELELEIHDGGDACLERRTWPVAFCEIRNRDGKLYVNRRQVPVRAAILPERPEELAPQRTASERQEDLAPQRTASERQVDLTLQRTASEQQTGLLSRMTDSTWVMELPQLREFLARMKRDFRNALLVPKTQLTEELRVECIRYGIYLLDAEDLSWKNLTDSHLRTVNTPASAACTKEERRSEKSLRQTNPDVELQIVQTGVLIENHSIFLNTSEYELYYEVTEKETSFVSARNFEMPRERALSKEPDRTGETGELATSEVSKIREESDLAAPKFCKSGVLQIDVPPQTSRFVEVPFEPIPRPGRYRLYAALRLKKDTVWALAGYVVSEHELELARLYY